MLDINRIINAIVKGRTKLDKLTLGFSRNPLSDLHQGQRFIDLLSYLDETLQLLDAIPDKVIREKNAKILLKIREENRLIDLMPDGRILYRLEDINEELDFLLEALTDLSTTKITEREQQPKLNRRSVALILLKQHPDWTDTKIAKEAGVRRTSPYRWPEYKKLRQLLRKPWSLPRGSKGKDGSIEAIAKD